MNDVDLMQLNLYYCCKNLIEFVATIRSEQLDFGELEFRIKSWVRV